MAMVYDAEYDMWYDDGSYADGTDYSNVDEFYGYGDGYYTDPYTYTSTDANAADNIDMGGGWNPATGTGDQATADAAAATGATDTSWYNTGSWDPSTWNVSDALKSTMSNILSTAKSTFTNKNGSLNIPALLTTAAGLYKLSSGNKTGSGGASGYSTPVPKLDMIRQQIQYNDTNRRPGSAGRQYFTAPQYVAQGSAPAVEAARNAAALQASGIAAAAPARPAQTNPWAGKMNLAALKPAQGNAMAHGGIAALAKGGRYLSGDTDGMADKIPTSIDGKDPAALSHGEFVIPADVVSHLGNGNSEAGANKLYDMMARIRKARTGTEKQGKKINPDKYMPGGLAKAYATGGAVKGFPDGGAVTSNTATGTTPTGTTGGLPQDVTKTSTLSPWVGDYVTNALGQGAALANEPYQAYTGPLTAGASDLQKQAFAGASEMAQTGYTPSTYSTGTFDAAAASKYMNPYLSAALQPALDEARRQAQISRQEDAGRLTKAGAFGGGRQAIMESELNRNLMDKQNKMLTEGYATAYDKAMNQFNTEQGRQFDVQKADEASRQFGATYGANAIKDLAALGATQRDIEQQGLAADKAQFEEQRDWAYKMPQYQLNLLQGLPISTNTTAVTADTLSQLKSDISGLAALYQTLANLGVTKP